MNHSKHDSKLLLVISTLLPWVGSPRWIDNTHSSCIKSVTILFTSKWGLRGGQDIGRKESENRQQTRNGAKIRFRDPFLLFSTLSLPSLQRAANARKYAEERRWRISMNYYSRNGRGRGCQNILRQKHEQATPLSFHASIDFFAGLTALLLSKLIWCKLSFEQTDIFVLYFFYTSRRNFDVARYQTNADAKKRWTVMKIASTPWKEKRTESHLFNSAAVSSRADSRCVKCQSELHFRVESAKVTPKNKRRRMFFFFPV